METFLPKSRVSSEGWVEAVVGPAAKMHSVVRRIISVAILAAIEVDIRDSLLALNFMPVCA